MYETWFDKRPHELLFPIGDPKTSGVESDGRVPYFTYVAICTNFYALTTGSCAGTGQSWETVSVPNLVKWTVCPLCIHAAIRLEQG